MHRCTGCISRIFNASTLHNAENQHLCLHLAAASYQRPFFAFTLRISIIFQLVSNSSRSSAGPVRYSKPVTSIYPNVVQFFRRCPFCPPRHISAWPIVVCCQSGRDYPSQSPPWSRWWHDFCNYNHQANGEFGWSRKMWVPEVYYFQFG